MTLLVPPPLVLLIAATLMWGVTRMVEGGRVQFPLQLPLAALLFVAGAALMAAAALAFLRARTTINPMRPSDASRLLTEGVFRYSRNPIYLADALLLAGVGVWLGSPWNIILLAGFVWYIDRIQIRAEERALRKRFGRPYRRYCEEVRRWI